MPLTLFAGKGVTKDLLVIERQREAEYVIRDNNIGGIGVRSHFAADRDCPIDD